MSVRISVVVPTYRRGDLLRRCLDALVEQDLAADAFEVVVADDAADRATELIVRTFVSPRGPCVRYVSVRGAHGPAAARNAGWRAAHGAIIAFTDDDCLPQPAWLRAGLAALEPVGAEVGAAAGRVTMPLPERPTDYERDAAGLERGEFVTANCFCRRAALEAVGGFDERFTCAWREDSDLQFTLLERGYHIVRATDAVVVHPIRPARWGVSLAQQRKTRFDPLLRRKHPNLSRERIAAFPWRYYITCIAAAIAIVATALGASRIAVVAGTVWTLATVDFCLRRLRGTTHRPAHVAEMLVTSVLIPPLSLYWYFDGQLKAWCLRASPQLRAD